MFTANLIYYFFNYEKITEFKRCQRLNKKEQQSINGGGSGQCADECHLPFECGIDDPRCQVVACPYVPGGDIKVCIYDQPPGQ